MNKSSIWANASLVYLALSSLQAVAGWDGKSPVGAPEMAVGDSWVHKEYYKTPHTTDIFRRTVIYVDPEGSFTMEVTTDDHHDLAWPRWDKNHVYQYEHARPVLNFPLRVGKSWRDRYQSISVDGETWTYRDKYKIMGIEKVNTPAGIFQAFKIRRTQKIIESPGNGGIEYYWYAPDVKAIVLSKPSWRFGRELLEYELAKQPGPQPSSPDEPHAFRMALTGKLDKDYNPTNDLAELLVERSARLVVFTKWRFPKPGGIYQISHFVLDSNGKPVKSMGRQYTPKSSDWNTWQTFRSRCRTPRGS